MRTSVKYFNPTHHAIISHIQEASSSNDILRKNKTERAKALSVLLVRVSRFELEAS